MRTLRKSRVLSSTRGEMPFGVSRLGIGLSALNGVPWNTGGRKAEFPKGVQRTGYSTELTLKRSEFGVDKFAGAVSDEVYVAISFEGTKK